MQATQVNKELRLKEMKRRILDISYRHKLSHLGSCLTALPILDEIYFLKQKKEKAILSSGHAGLALYVVIEKYEGIDAEKIFEHHGVHPDRCNQCHLYCSTGSLGQGLPIAVGMALADRKKNVYCLISDGECSEGSIMEALRIQREQALTNLKVYINCNGYGAYKKVEITNILNPIICMSPYIRYTNTLDFPFLVGQDAHYHVMTEEEYKTGMEILK